MHARVPQIVFNDSISTLQLIKSELKALSIRYLEQLNLITVVGWSISDEVWVKYLQMLEDIETHLRYKGYLNIYFKLELFDSTSARYLFKIIKKLNMASSDGKSIKIYWSCSFFNRDEMEEMGHDLEEMCDFPFQISRT